MKISVRDLGLAAALTSLDYKILATEKDESGRTQFVFVKSPELENSVNAYWANTLDVKARYYFDAIKMLKSRIYGGR